MKTKREVLEEITKKGHCIDIICEKCPYNLTSSDCSFKFQKIGAMAILRMFRKKKKPLLSAGTKIKFSDGRIATIIKSDTFIANYHLDFGGCYKGADYLIGKTWEVVE
jgi:hypothetical protein